MDIKLILQNYKEATNSFIQAIEEDKIEEGQVFLEKREEAISGLKELNINSSEFRSLVKELNLIELDKVANKTLSKMRENIKKEIIELKNSKQASKIYGSISPDVKFFDKQI